MVDEQLDDELTGADEENEESEFDADAPEEGSGLGGDDLGDDGATDESDDEADEKDGAEGEGGGSSSAKSAGESDEDDEEPDPDDVEEDLDTILRDKIAANEDEDDDEDEETPPPADTSTETGNRVSPKRPGEFVCQSCFLVKPRSQLADADSMFCNDCM